MCKAAHARTFLLQIKLVTTVCLILLGMTVIVSCGTNSPTPELLVPVSAQISTDTATVTRGPVIEVERYTGIVRAESVPINFGATSALFYSFYVRPGDYVSYGQLLARLDTTHINEQIINQELHISRMQEDFQFQDDMATININMQARIGENTAPARLELEFARERQALILSHAEADLQMLIAQLGPAELRAPFDGTITFLSDYAYGMWVAPFSPVMYISSVDADAFIEYTGTTHISPLLTHIQAHIDGEIYDIARIPMAIELVWRYERMPIRFSIITDEMPPAGALVTLYAYRHLMEDVLRVPRNALFFCIDMGFYVYLINDGQREMAHVTVGTRTETYVEIISGVSEGEEIYVRS